MTRSNVETSDLFDGSVQIKNDRSPDDQNQTDYSSNDAASDESVNEPDVDEMDYEKNLRLREEIKMWTMKLYISHLAYNELSVILNKRIKHILPNDARTLLQTTRQEIQITALGIGHYWHNGLKKQLIQVFEHGVVPLPNNITTLSITTTIS